MKDYLIVVDMQKDFVDGALGTKEAVAIVPAVLAKVKKAAEEGQHIIFTRDTHEETYLETQEGHNLPVTHCVRGSEGWEISKELEQNPDKISPAAAAIVTLEKVEEEPVPEKVNGEKKKSEDIEIVADAMGVMLEEEE